MTACVMFVYFFFYGYGDHRDLHSSPPRRSSDLGRVKVEGGSLAALIQAVRPGALPGPLGQSFSLEASVSAGADSAEVKGMNVRLGTTQASGEVTVALGKTVSVAVRLGANRIDLDQWLALPEISAGAVPAGRSEEHTSELQSQA